jgi:hypothetical protein
MLAGGGRRGVSLKKEAFIIVKYICTAYAVEYSLKSLQQLNISLHLLNYQLTEPRYQNIQHSYCINLLKL